MRRTKETAVVTVELELTSGEERSFEDAGYRVGAAGELELTLEGDGYREVAVFAPGTWKKITESRQEQL